MNIAHIEESSLIYGPGIRFVIWVQGCSIRCKGCWNQDMWSFETKNIISTEEIIHKINQVKNNVSLEGVTILGGEPFDQYEELLKLAQRVQKEKLTLLLYTGYTMKELKKYNKTKILDYTDILITGRFIEKYVTRTGGLIGSSNQKIHFLTNKYSEKDLPTQNEIEISINENGQINMYGYPYEFELEL